MYVQKIEQLDRSISWFRNKQIDLKIKFGAEEKEANLRYSCPNSACVSIAAAFDG
jgi:hypothetical protein